MTPARVRTTTPRTALRTALISAAALIALSACASGGSHGHGRAYTAAPAVAAPSVHYDKVGTASWYGAAYDGRTTANGERFDMHALSGAHATLPIPSIVEVTNLENGRSIRVRVNDRGPFKDGRVIDLSKGAAEALGYVAQGVTKVRVRYIGPAPLLSAEPTVSLGARPVFAPLPLAPASDGAGFAVQAGAFADRNNAERLLERLKATGPAAIRPAQRGRGRLYRVVIGPWEAEADARQALQQITELGFSDAHIVRF